MSQELQGILTKSREPQSLESNGHVGVLHSSSRFPFFVVFTHLRGGRGSVHHPHLVTHSTHTHTQHTHCHYITPTVWHSSIHRGRSTHDIDATYNDICTTPIYNHFHSHSAGWTLLVRYTVIGIKQTVSCVTFWIAHPILTDFTTLAGCVAILPWICDITRQADAFPTIIATLFVETFLLRIRRQISVK